LLRTVLGHGVCDTGSISTGEDLWRRASVSYISIFGSVGWSLLYCRPTFYILISMNIFWAPS
jgi:hypothetical protein